MTGLALAPASTRAPLLAPIRVRGERLGQREHYAFQPAGHGENCEIVAFNLASTEHAPALRLRIGPDERLPKHPPAIDWRPQ